MRGELHLGVTPRDEGVVGEVDVVAFAADDRGVGRAVDHQARAAAAQQLGDAQRRRPARAGVVVRPVGLGVVGDDRRAVELQHLLADQEAGAKRQRHGAADAQVDAVDGLLVAHDEAAVAVEEVGVHRRQVRVVGEQQRAVDAAGVVLVAGEREGDAVEAIAADQREPGPGDLHRAEVRRRAALARVVATGGQRRRAELGLLEAGGERAVAVGHLGAAVVAEAMARRDDDAARRARVPGARRRHHRRRGRGLDPTSGRVQRDGGAATRTPRRAHRIERVAVITD